MTEALLQNTPTSFETLRKSAGHVIVDTLVAHGIERTFVVPGESFLDVLDGLHDSPIETVVCRHEGGAAYMAEAEGKMNQLPGIAMVTRGPGAANAHVGLHTAWQDSTPMVLFVGLIPFAHLAASSKPLFVTGGNDWTQEGADQLTRWLEAHHIPAAAEWRT